MPSIAEQNIIARFSLEPHPEGGWFREVVRSQNSVRSDDGRRRSSLTSIYFLLCENNISRWHVVKSDELWILLDGALAVHTFDRATKAYSATILGPENRQHLVPADQWQAAEPLGGFAFCACAVAPGFDFADFRMIGDSDEDNLIKTELFRCAGVSAKFFD